MGASLGLAVWCEDEAGPFQAVPHPGASWQPEGHPARQPHEYVRGGTAKVLTLFRPVDGHVRVEGATSVTNAVLHPWLKRELAAVLAELPTPPPTADASRAAWERWQTGLTRPITLPDQLPNASRFGVRKCRYLLTTRRNSVYRNRPSDFTRTGHASGKPNPEERRRSMVRRSENLRSLLPI